MTAARQSLFNGELENAIQQSINIITSSTRATDDEKRSLPQLLNTLIEQYPITSSRPYTEEDKTTLETEIERLKGENKFGDIAYLAYKKIADLATRTNDERIHSFRDALWNLALRLGYAPGPVPVNPNVPGPVNPNVPVPVNPNVPVPAPVPVNPNVPGPVNPNVPVPAPVPVNPNVPVPVNPNVPGPNNSFNGLSDRHPPASSGRSELNTTLTNSINFFNKTRKRITGLPSKNSSRKLIPLPTRPPWQASRRRRIGKAPESKNNKEPESKKNQAPTRPPQPSIKQNTKKRIRKRMNVPPALAPFSS